MSLILEALKKLERDRKLPDRGFVVLASQGWPERQGRGARRWLSLALGLAVVVAAVALWTRPALSPTAPLPPAAPTAPPTAALPPPPTWGGDRGGGSLGGRPAAPAADAAPPASTLTPSPAAPVLVLQAITQRDGRPVALINDRLVREGDEFDGVRILRIGDTEVEVEVQGRRSVLRF